MYSLAGVDMINVGSTEIKCAHIKLKHDFSNLSR